MTTWRRKVLALAVLLVARGVGAQDHSDVVRQVKSELDAAGVDLSTHGLPELACNPFQITKRVAWRLRSEGAGLLDKPAGNNCQGFATDIIAYANGNIVDILSDGGGSNGPQWQCCDTVDPKRYRSAFDPNDPAPPPVVPPPSPPPPVVDDFAARVYAKLQELATHADILRAEDTTRNEAANTRTNDTANAEAIKGEMHHVWRDLGTAFLDLLKQPATWTAIAGVLAGLRMGGKL